MLHSIHFRFVSRSRRNLALVLIIYLNSSWIVILVVVIRIKLFVLSKVLHGTFLRNSLNTLILDYQIFDWIFIYLTNSSRFTEILHIIIFQWAIWINKKTTLRTFIRSINVEFLDKLPRNIFNRSFQLCLSWKCCSFPWDITQLYIIGVKLIIVQVICLLLDQLRLLII